MKKPLNSYGQAAHFVAVTKVDALAVSIGTVHGMYKKEPRIDLQVLKEIAAKVAVPLVLHGGSGTPVPLIRECILNGIAKINVNTEISLYAVTKLRKLLAPGTPCHLSQLALQEKEYVKDVVRKHITMFI